MPAALAPLRAEPSRARVPGPTDQLRIDVVIPVYNEEHDLPRCVQRLRAYLDASIPYSSMITIVDNASTDSTGPVAERLSATVPGVRAIHLDEKGRGRALRAAWSASEAAVVAYMDVDLSTNLNALLPLLAAVLSGHSDLAIGSRLAPGARVVRGPKRELISRAYNLLLRGALRNNFSDAQCGFKAIRADEARALLPSVLDEEWFFDTELLVLAERNGLRIHEVPVDWSDDPESTVHIAKTAWADIRGVCRLISSFTHGRDAIEIADAGGEMELAALKQFAGVGLVSTLAYLALLLGLRSVMDIFVANTVALAVSGLANALAHAWLTFGSRRRVALRPRIAGALVAFASSLALTSIAIAIAGALAPASEAALVVALVVGTAAAAFVRFTVFSALVFRSHLHRRDLPGGVAGRGGGR